MGPAWVCPMPDPVVPLRSEKCSPPHPASWRLFGNEPEAITALPAEEEPLSLTNLHLYLLQIANLLAGLGGLDILVGPAGTLGSMGALTVQPFIN